MNLHYVKNCPCRIQTASGDAAANPESVTFDLTTSASAFTLLSPTAAASEPGRRSPIGRMAAGGAQGTVG